MNLKPLYEKIVIRNYNVQEVTSTSGLVYQKNMSLNNNTTIVGEVVSVGCGRLLANGEVVPLKVNVGDKVIYSKLQGESYSDGKTEYTILSESNILAILED